MPPDQLWEYMSRYLEEQSQVITSHGGQISKYIADNIFCFWDKPGSETSACASALSQKKAVAGFRAWAKEQGYPAPEFRIGIHTAAVALHRGPAPDGPMVLGDGVNLAARLDKLNKEYGTEILISEATRVALPDTYTVRLADIVCVKGMNEPLKLFELVGNSIDVGAEKREMLAAYHTAHALYCANDARASLGAFLDLQRRWPDDRLISFYVSRCQEMVRNPAMKVEAGVMYFHFDAP